MSEKQTSQSPKPASASTSTDAGQAEIQQQWDEANEQGYFGEVPDETPNEAYTVEGVTKQARKERKQ